MPPIRSSARLLLLPLLLAGCGDNTNSSQPAIDQTDVSSQTTGQAQDSYTITDTAAGPVQLGMLSSDILATLPGATAAIEQDGEGIEWMTVSLNGESLMNIMLDRTTHTANLIRILSPRFITQSGVKVGENLQSVGEKLGGLTEIQWTEIEAREFATFAKTPATMIFQVIGKSDSTAGVYSNGDTITTVADSSATIQSIWLMED
ncbi:hypothetical protein [Thiothrix lacustris]|uniref:hypothetical protein n=1 Tax=Thiothrix lacustris TaxID=525917 RepID=UPI0027E52A1E|nr:hypothetical protein [Thiothrix lacustris]WMP15956.1 hypothetical protein RCS87_11180 [Thiothrix lacustris]